MKSSSKKKHGLMNVLFPKRPNVEYVVDYYTSKHVTREPKKNFCWDTAKCAPDMQIVEEKAKLHENETILANNRAIMKKMRIELDADWEDLREKEETFRDMFVKFNRFVRENIEKRERASQKAYDQFMLRIQRHDAILALNKKICELAQIKRNMDRKIRQFRIYEIFLDEVLDRSEQEFKSVLDILNRYETLIVTRQSLAKKQEKDLTALENARTTMSKSIESFSLLILGLNNRLNDLHLRYGMAQRSCIKWESICSQIKVNIVEKVSEIVSLRQNCLNLYRFMCERKSIQPDIDPEDMEAHFIFIKKTLMDMKRIDDKLKLKENSSTRIISSKGKRNKS